MAHIAVVQRLPTLDTMLRQWKKNTTCIYVSTIRFNLKLTPAYLRCFSKRKRLLGIYHFLVQTWFEGGSFVLFNVQRSTTNDQRLRFSRFSKL